MLPSLNGASKQTRRVRLALQGLKWAGTSALRSGRSAYRGLGEVPYRFVLDRRRATAGVGRRAAGPIERPAQRDGSRALELSRRRLVPSNGRRMCSSAMA